MNRPICDLRGKSAIVTGASRGIGRAIALRLAGAGARVVVASRKRDACQIVVDEISEAGGMAMALTCDVTVPKTLEDIIVQTRAAWGTLDVLVCNAAVNPYFGSCAALTQATFERVVTANVWSTLHLSNLAAPLMAEGGAGAIIVISSVTTSHGTGKIGAYAMSKAAEEQLIRNLALEWGPRKVRINGISPGLIQTHLSKAFWDDAVLQARVSELFPIGRIGRPDDIASLAVFLASDDASYITGQCIIVDGGMTIVDPLEAGVVRPSKTQA